jgi:CheY-like chemotaxis protein
MSKILIAEDNPVNRELLRELLEMRGRTIVEACDGEEALRGKALSSDHTDAVWAEMCETNGCRKQKCD